MIPALEVMNRSKVASLPIYQEKENSASKNLSCFWDLKQVIRNSMKTTWNNKTKSMRFDLLIEELPFQSNKIEHELIINLNNHDWEDLKISMFQIFQ